MARIALARGQLAPLRHAITQVAHSPVWVPWQEFYRDSFFFPYLLHISATAKAVSDFSSFWLREYHLAKTGQVRAGGPDRFRL